MLRRCSKELLYVLLGLTLSSCFQFRYSDKKQLKYFEEKNVKVGLGSEKVLGQNMHYSLTKEPKETLVVFVHGSPGSSSNFIHFLVMDSLLDIAQLMAIDRPGFGSSDFGKSEPDLNKQSAKVLGVLDKFNEKNIILVGHSLGGPLICKMAMDRPDLVDGLVIIAGSVSPELEPEEKWRKPLNSPFLRWILPRSFRVSNQEILPVKKYLVEMEQLWKNIKVPVTIIQGDKDGLVPPGNADYAKEKLSNAEVRMLKFPDKDHFIPFSEPEIVSSEIIKLSQRI